MKRVITIDDVQDYLNQFDGNAEVILMDDDHRVRPDDADGPGFISLETMMAQFHDTGDE